MKGLRIAAVVLLLLVLGGWAGRDWLGITDIPADTLRQQYGEGSRYVELLGAPVRIKESGQGEPLLLLHGFAASADTWEGWRKALEGHYRVIAVDVPPFGLTGPLANRPMQPEDLQYFMDALVTKLELKSFYLAGNSLGGYMAWKYAARHPEQVKKLILVDSAGYPLDVPFAVRLMQTPVIRDVTTHLSPYPLVASSVKEVYGQPQNVTATQIQRYHDMMRREGARLAVTELVSRLNYDGQGIDQVKTPTLIMWGAKDRWIPPAHAPLFHKAIAGSQLVTYEELGHIPMEEDPQRTAADALKFLQQ